MLTSKDFLKLPMNSEAENAIIGVLLLDQSRIGSVLGIMELEHLIDPYNQAIFRELKTAHMKGEVVEFTQFYSRLQDKVPIEVYAKRTDGMPVFDVTNLAKEVRDLWIRRQFMKIGEALISEASESEKIDGLATRYQTAMFELLKGRVDSVYMLSEAIQLAMEEIEACRSKNEFPGVSTHITRLNKYTGGFRKGYLIILAARPSLGKTALAVNFTYHLIQNKNSILFISAEMSKEDIAKRMLAIRAQIPGETLINNPSMLSNDDIKTLKERLYGFRMNEMHIMDDPQVSLDDIFNAAETVKRRSGLDLIVVDYIQLLHNPNPKQYVRNMNDYIAEISISLKHLSRSFKVPVLALSQLNREGEDSTKLSTLRGSGQLEQDADVVLMLYKDTEGYKLRVAKSRNGRCGYIELEFNPETMFFSERAGPEAGVA